MGTLIFKKDYNLNLDVFNKCIKGGIVNSRLGLLFKSLAHSIDADGMNIEQLDQHDMFFIPKSEPEKILWENLRESAKIQIRSIEKNRLNGQKGGRPKREEPAAHTVRNRDVIDTESESEKEENKYFEMFVDWWNSKFLENQYNTEGNIAKISVINQKRKTVFKSRWADTKTFMTKNQELKPKNELEIYDFMRKNVIAYNYINSDFLQGKVKGYNHAHGYDFSYDSIFAPGMWTKLLENKFINKD